MRRLAGPIAAITAATVLAATPVTVILDRGNISDSLLILLTVMAADATAAAIVEERPRRLLLAALWVGLAFQAKMMQAWLVLPALALPYLLAAGGSARTRLVKELRLVEHTRVAYAVYTSALAASTIFYAGTEVLPLGGHSGRFPSPTVSALAHYVKTGQLRFIDVPISPSADSKLVTWVRTHCAWGGERAIAKGVVMGNYACHGSK